MSSDTIWLVLAGLSAWLGCAWLALGQKKNWRTVTGGNTPPRACVGLGWMFVLATLISCVMRDGVSFAAILWPLIFATAAFLVAMTLAYRTQWLKPLASILG